MNTSTSSATTAKLRITFATHGLPEIVVTDNDSNFVSREFEDFLKQNRIHHIRTAPYQLASNGMAERAVQTFKEGMKKMNDGSWCGDACFTISCSLQNHPSDFNRSVAGRTASRKETQIKTRPSLPRSGKESATKSGFSETGT